MAHLPGLTRIIPDILARESLDLGSGRGSFLLEFAEAGGSIRGIEYFDRYIEEAKERLAERGLHVEVLEGKGEELPYPDSSFRFVNMAEVIEHVEDPKKVLSEVHRVLADDGVAYVSVPARFSLRDPHYKLYGVNWLPRSMSDGFVRLFGKDKGAGIEAGRQRLSDMHYFTYGQFVRLAESVGFTVRDGREERIRKEMPIVLRPFALMAYKALLRPFYFDTAHTFLSKKHSSV